MEKQYRIKFIIEDQNNEVVIQGSTYISENFNYNDNSKCENIEEEMWKVLRGFQSHYEQTRP